MITLQDALDNLAFLKSVCASRKDINEAQKLVDAIKRGA